MSRFPLAELLERTAADVHPPLYYLLLKAWTAAFGDSPLAMRSMRALFGVLTILAAYDLVRQARMPSQGQVSPLLGAAGLQASNNPSGRLEIRPSAGAALLVAALNRVQRLPNSLRLGGADVCPGDFPLRGFRGGSVRALRNRDKPGKWWVVYGALIILFAYTHYFALLSIAAQGLFLTRLFPDPSRWKMVRSDA